MKNFEEVYEKLCTNSKEKLESEKNNYRKASRKITMIIAIIAIIITAICIMLMGKNSFVYVLPIALMVTVLIIFIIVNVKKNKYGVFYKNNVINEILENYEKNLKFDAKGGITLGEYHEGFNDQSESISSEDLIYGTTENGIEIKMSQIRATHEEITTDGDGNTTTTTVTDYDGVYGIAKINNSSKSNIIISKNSKFGRYKGERIELESAVFEKDYDVFSEDRLYAMKVFKPELIEEFSSLKEKEIKKFEAKIIKNTIYFRYRSGDIFKPPVRKDALDKELIKSYVNTIETPLRLISSIDISIKDSGVN